MFRADTFWVLVYLPNDGRYRVYESKSRLKFRIATHISIGLSDDADNFEDLNNGRAQPCNNRPEQANFKFESSLPFKQTIES